MFHYFSGYISWSDLRKVDQGEKWRQHSWRIKYVPFWIARKIERRKGRTAKDRRRGLSRCNNHCSLSSTVTSGTTQIITNLTPLTKYLTLFYFHHSFSHKTTLFLFPIHRPGLMRVFKHFHLHQCKYIQQ